MRSAQLGGGSSDGSENGGDMRHGRMRWTRAARRLCVVCGVIGALATSITVVGQAQGTGGPVFSSMHEPGVGGRVTAISLKPGSTSPTDPAAGVVLVGGDMLGVHHSETLGDAWSPSTGLLSYEMADFTWDPRFPDQVWAGSMSGPALSIDGGVTFVTGTDGMASRRGMGPLSGYPYSSPVQRVVYLDDDTVLAFGGSQRQWAEDNGQPTTGYGRVWIATRSGTTQADGSTFGWQDWTVRSTLPGNIVTAAKVGTRIYAVVRGGPSPGVYVSDDLAVSFKRAAAPAGSYDELSDLATFPGDPEKVWVTRAARTVGRTVVPGAVYFSADHGATWAVRNPPQITSGNQDQVSGYDAIETSAQIAVNGVPVLYTSDVGQKAKATFRSLDGGVTWLKILDPDLVSALNLVYSGGGDMSVLAVDPANPYLLFAGSQEHLLSAEPADAGSPATSALTWSDRATNRTGPGAKAFGRGISGLVATRVAFDPVHPGAVALNAMDGGNLLWSTDGGTGWTRPLVHLAGRAAADDWMDAWFGAYDTTFGKSALGNPTMYVLKGQIGWFAGVARSEDGGLSFKLLEAPRNGLPTGIDFKDHKAAAVEAMRNGEVLLTLDGCLYRTVNDGATWTKDNKSCSLVLGDLARDPASAPHVYAQGKSGVYESFDYGTTWKLMTKGNGSVSPGASPRGGHLSVRTGSTAGAGALYATSTDGTAPGGYRWDGPTLGWTKILDATPYNNRVFEIAPDPTSSERLAAVVIDFPYHDKTFAPGVLIQTAKGGPWSAYSEGLGELRAAAVAWDPFTAGHLVVGTYGQGFYQAWF